MDLLGANSYQGLCAYVLKTVDNATRRGVVVGHDHRHYSERWAALTAAAFLSNGVKVYLLRGFVHTPLWVLATPSLVPSAQTYSTVCHLALGCSEQPAV